MSAFPESQSLVWYLIVFISKHHDSMGMLIVPPTIIWGEEVCLIEARKAKSMKVGYVKGSLRLGESLGNSRPTTLKWKYKYKWAF